MPDFKPKTWEDIGAQMDHPDEILLQWGLETRGLRERIRNSQSRSQSQGQSQGPSAGATAGATAGALSIPKDRGV